MTYLSSYILLFKTLPAVSNGIFLKRGIWYFFLESKNTPQKKYILDIESRLLLCREATSDLEGVEVCYYDGYAVEYCLTHSISAIVRGIRNSQDYEYEKWLESENRKIGEIETVYLYADSEYVEVSSTKARQMLVEGDTSIIPVSRQTIEKVWGETYGKPNESNR